MPDLNALQQVNRREFFRYCLYGIGSGIALCMLPSAISAASQAKHTFSRKNAFYWQDLHEHPTHIKHTLDAPAIQSRLAPPGSIMKLLITACILENQLAQVEESILCNGSIQIGQNRYHCKEVHGKMILPTALGQSCNVFFAQIAQRIPLSQLSKTFNQVGWQQLQKQITPSLSTPEAKSLLALGLDPAFAVSPQDLLQLSQHLAKHSAGFQKKTVDVLYQGLRLAASEGTGKQLDPKNHWQLALKTGTIPRITPHRYESWITGFFPIQKPRYLFCAYSPEGSSVEALIPYVKKELDGRTW